MKYLRTLSLVLAVVFIILQLENIIDWNWLMVLSPVWIYASLHLLVRIIAVYLEATYPDRLKRSMHRSLEAASRKIKERETKS